MQYLQNVSRESSATITPLSPAALHDIDGHAFMFRRLLVVDTKRASHAAGNVRTPPPPAKNHRRDALVWIKEEEPRVGGQKTGYTIRGGKITAASRNENNQRLPQQLQDTGRPRLIPKSEKGMGTKQHHELAIIPILG